MKEVNIKNKEGVVVIRHHICDCQNDTKYHKIHKQSSKVYDSFKIEPHSSNRTPSFLRNFFCHHLLGQKK